MTTEKRLIDATDFVKTFWQRVHDGEIVTLMDVEHAIINANTVDAVEVVRCKDCKHYRHFKGCGNWCHRRFRSNIEFKVKPTDFCSYGERRTNENSTDHILAPG